MYREHFGLVEKPFDLIPDPDFLYLSAKHQAAFTMLEFGLLEVTGITVISGEVGSGKTTLLRHLLKRINYDDITVGMINNIHHCDEDLMQWVVSAYNLSFESQSRVALHRALEEYLVQEYAQGRRVVLIVDEAQNISKKSLEELRLISNINADKDQLMQIILVGQPELLTLLCSPELSQIAQRVSAEYHLEPLSLKETIEYVCHRLQVAGGHYIFETFAISVIYYFAGGVPRLINTLCDYALVHAYALDKTKVDLGVALEVVKGKRIGGIERVKEKNEDMEQARRTLYQATGIDLAEIFKP
jgi:general secretion pathway protein A